MERQQITSRLWIIWIMIVLGWQHEVFPQTEITIEEWAHRFNGPSNARDQASKTAVDSAGNVIVGGITDGIAGEDFVIIKYSNNGVTLWTNRYNGEGNSIDRLVGVDVDSGGNVFIAGGSLNAAQNLDYVTIKYSSAGVPIWTNRYDGPSHGDDTPVALAIDSSGCVIVTGRSFPDIVTLKYSNSGALLWSARHSEPFDQSVLAMATDGSDNVVVGGSAWNGFSYNFLTLKYSNSGVPLWTNLYDGPNGGSDQASAVAVDGDGNVFVTGSSTGIGSASDYATLMYSSSGVPLWTNRYNGPGNSGDFATGVVADGNGNTFVTGKSVGVGSLDDFATIGYTSAGEALWTNRFTSTGNRSDAAQFVALAADGGVLIAGTILSDTLDLALLKCSPAGIPLWTNYYSFQTNSGEVPKALALDNSGNIFISGDSYVGSGAASDVVTIAYASNGTPQWTNRYSGQGSFDDIPCAIAVDPSGEVFVAGYSADVGNSSAFTTIKYSSAGTPLWVARYGAGSRATAMTLDSAGNVIVTGESWSGTSYGYGTIKYSNVGVPLWTNWYGGQNVVGDVPSSLATDANRNIFVTGRSHNGNTADFATIGYSAAGVALWTNLYNGTANFDDAAFAIAVDGSGNVVVAGISRNVGSLDDYVTIKYSNSGIPLWTNRYSGPGGLTDGATAAAVDGNGNVFVTGYVTRSPSAQDYATIKYSSAGVPLWTNLYIGPGNGTDQAFDLAVDGDGNVYVTGRSWGGTSSDFLTVKYSNSGTPLWTNRYNGPGNFDDIAFSVMPDESGRVFVTGSSIGSGSTNDIATIAYSAAGQPLWTNRYNGPANGNDLIGGKNAITVSSNGSVYVIGSSNGDYAKDTSDFVTIKYTSLQRPHMLTPELQTDGRVLVSFQGRPGLPHKIEYNHALGSAWTSLGTSIPATNGVGTLVDSNSPAGKSFYRAVYP